MRRDLYEADHEAFRASVRGFVDRYVRPHHAEWEAAGIVDRGVWLEAGTHGLLGFELPEEYGGGGVADFRYNAVVVEEIMRANATGIGFGLHNDIVAPYLVKLATEDQRQRWFPGFCSGELITAIAMSEPAAGSDLQGIQTTAVRDGDDWVLNGSKTFITNGINSDLVIVVARTDVSKGAHGISLLVVERGMAGFERGRNLDKIGLKAQDTAELFFSDVRVPAANLLGEENRGFIHLMDNLPQERLSIAVGGLPRPSTPWRSRSSTARPGLRSAGRSGPSRTPASSSPSSPPRSRSPGSTWTSRSRSTTPGATTRPTRPWRSGGPPSCRSASSTRASSSTAATAT
jgi:alkylation response protein AidB-like acyl-CoA dehydrogenase